MTDRQIHVRMPAHLVDKLDQVADHFVVGRNLVINRAIEFYLDQLPDHCLPRPRRPEPRTLLGRVLARQQDRR